MTLPDYDDLKRLDFLTKLHALLDEHKSYIDVESFLNTRYIKEPDIRIIEPNLITLIWEQHNKRLVLNQLLSDRKTMERNHAIFSNDYYL